VSVPNINCHTAKIFRAVDTSHRLEKIAVYYATDAEVVKQAATAKAAVDVEVFDLVKQAQSAGLLRRALSSDAARKAGTGALVGAGATLPAVAGGSYLLGKARDDASLTASDVRNKVLQSALGLAGIGAGMYGLQQLTGANIPKQASDNDEAREELVQKLATVEVIETRFAAIDQSTLSPEAVKLSEEVRALNRSYGVRLLYEAANA
jgi:hypothetical protein